ncbi:hypothetical protein GQ457_18G017680 [Hibiscus cannabinus]
MAIRMPGIMQARHILRQSKLFANQAMDVPKGYFAVYVWEFILEQPFLSGVVKRSRGRIRIQSSYGRSHNSLQRRERIWQSSLDVPRGFFAVC